MPPFLSLITAKKRVIFKYTSIVVTFLQVYHSGFIHYSVGLYTFKKFFLDKQKQIEKRPPPPPKKRRKTKKKEQTEKVGKYDKMYMKRSQKELKITKKKKKKRFGLFSLFNGISTFMGYKCQIHPCRRQYW